MPEKPDSGASARVSQTAPASVSLSHTIWKHLEAIPGLPGRIKRAIRDIDQGKGVSAKEYRANR